MAGPESRSDVLNLSVETNMRPQPPVVSPQESISHVMELMTRENIGSVVVSERDALLGIVTEKDILHKVLRLGKDPDLTLANDAMSKPLITIESDRTINEALSLLEKHSIRRLAVTRGGLLIGLTTERRLLEIAHNNYLMHNQIPVQKTGGFDKKIRIGFISTYPPRECGIATFTSHLADAISTFCTGAVKSTFVVALNDKRESYAYENRVKYQIEADDHDSYENAAEYVNASDIDVVSLQHEFGIFGGKSGEYVNAFLSKVRKPVVTTLHTILEAPTDETRNVLETIIEKSDAIIVMATVGSTMLEQHYRCPPDKIRYIPHGCPNVPYIETAMIKRGLGLQRRIVLSTFGLLSSGKGVEHAIEALPEIVPNHPDVLYLVIGETHPEVRKREGEKYRQELLDKVDSLGLSKNVSFVNRFLTENELISYLQATDIYIIPYPNREQISSGTLSYALSAGKAIVTTPFLHAEEIIAKEAALGCQFRDPRSIARSVTALIEDGKLLRKLSRNAYDYSRPMIWPNVAMNYVNSFYRSLGL